MKLPEDRIVGVIRPNGEVEFEYQKIGELKDREVLIKVYASLISPGTEMMVVKNWRSTQDATRKNLYFGYANAGEIIAVKGDVKNLSVGMRVMAMGGGYAIHGNYTKVPVNMVMPIPDNVSYEEGAYGCLAATSLQGIRRMKPELGEYGMVFGLGIVGNLCAQFAQLSGSHVLGVDGWKSRMAIARKCRIKNLANLKNDEWMAQAKQSAQPYGMDWAMMAFGGEATETFKKLKSCMKVSQDGHEMGRVVLIGGCFVSIGGGANTGNLDILASSRTGAGYHDPEYEYGKDYAKGFVQFTTERNLREIASLLSEKRLIVTPMTTHHLPLERIGEAAELLIDHPDKTLGIIMQMSHD